MKALHDDRSSDRIVRTAAWFYVAPRAALGMLILAVLGLAAFLIFAEVALVVLRRLGA